MRLLTKDEIKKLVKEKGYTHLETAQKIGMKTRQGFANWLNSWNEKKQRELFRALNIPIESTPTYFPAPSGERTKKILEALTVIIDMLEKCNVDITINIEPKTPLDKKPQYDFKGFLIDEILTEADNYKNKIDAVKYLHAALQEWQNNKPDLDPNGYIYPSFEERIENKLTALEREIRLEG